MATSKSALALHGGEPAHRGQWPAWPVHDEREREALLAVLDSGKWWYGERVAEFEAAFAAFQDARFGVTCCNGTVALELALLGAGVGTGHEVLVPPYTFIATATAVLKANAVPVFVDVEPDTLNLDPAQLEAAVTERTAPGATACGSSRTPPTPGARSSTARAAARWATRGPSRSRCPRTSRRARAASC